MKRHDSLVPLSREHHDGLLLAVRLQQGEKALERLWSHDPAWQAAEVVRFFDAHLAEHFRTEEEELFSEASALPGMGEVVRTLVEEHASLRSLAQGFRSGAVSPALLAQFGEILERHIRSEERVLFPACQEQLPEATLARLASVIGQRHGGAQ
jgi:hemerythrin-like domain-containing protein